MRASMWMSLGKAGVWLGVWSLAGCQSSTTPPRLEPCAPADPDTSVAVDGIYDYHSPVFGLSGTITFAQEDDRVSVLETTYQPGDDARSLVGEADLAGNRLDLTLVPANGDTDYTAEVSLIFEDGGQSFCLAEFSDTNDDVGGEGTYRGRRQP